MAMISTPLTLCGGEKSHKATLKLIHFYCVPLDSRDISEEHINNFKKSLNT